MVRGAAMVRSNWRLVPLRWLLALTMGLLSLLAMGLPVIATGRGVLDPPPRDFAALEGWGRDLMVQIAEQPRLFAISLAGSFLLLVVALLVWAFTESGTFGILVSADRQAPPRASSAAWFKTFSMGDFFGWGGRYLWRFVGLILFFLVAGLVLSLLVGGLTELTVSGGQEWLGWAAVGVGGGRALPLTFLSLTLVAVFWLAMADLPREGSGPWPSLKCALHLLGRRLGAVSVLFGVWIAAEFALSLALFSPRVELRAWGAGSLGASLLVNIGGQLLQGLLAQLLHVWFGASLVALVRSERGAMDSPRMPTVAENTP